MTSKGRIILDGKYVSEIKYKSLKEEIHLLKIKPFLVAILVGDDSASKTYVNAKMKACKKIGIKSKTIQFPNTVSQNDLLQQINSLNKDKLVTGYIIQLPLPKHINELDITSAILPQKDVDGFHPYNLGRLMINKPTLQPATPKGIITLLKHYNIKTEGKHCVVIGRSNIVGTPINLMLSRNRALGNATTTIIHSYSKNIDEILLSADIIIVAVGKPHFLKKSMVKKGAVVIDVGIHSVKDDTRKKGYKLVGDVDYEEVKMNCSAISRVPGGVGPMTILSLIENTVKAYKTKRTN